VRDSGGVAHDDVTSRLAALEHRVARAESILAIQAMKARYAELVDARFARGAVVEVAALGDVVAAIAALFTVDGIWDGGPGLGRAQGRPAIAAALAAPTLSFSRHIFTNPRIDSDGTRATGRWDLLSPCRRRDGTSYWMCGVEDDEYELVEGSWLHRSMRLTTVVMAPVGSGWERVFV